MKLVARRRPPLLILLLAVAPLFFHCAARATAIPPKVFHFPEATSALAAQWLKNAEQVTITLSGGPPVSKMMRYQWSKGQKENHVNVLISSKFYFLPKDPFFLPDTQLLHIEVRNQLEVRHWHWPADHPAGAVQNVMTFLTKHSQNSPAAK